TPVSAKAFLRERCKAGYTALLTARGMALLLSYLPDIGGLEAPKARTPDGYVEMLLDATATTFRRTRTHCEHREGRLPYRGGGHRRDPSLPGKWRSPAERRLSALSYFKKRAVAYPRPGQLWV